MAANQEDQEVLTRLSEVAQPISEQIPFWERANIRPKELAVLLRENRVLKASSGVLDEFEQEIGDLSKRIEMATQAVEQREQEHQRLIQEAQEELQQLELLKESIRKDLLILLSTCKKFGGYAKTARQMNTQEWMFDYWGRFSEFERLVDSLTAMYEGKGR